MSIFSAGQSVQLLHRILDPTEPTEPMIPALPQKPSIPTNRSSQPLPADTPEKQGVSSARIAAFLRELAAEPTLNMHSVLVVRHGKLLCRAAFGAQRTDLPRQTYSACKSITALAVGLAMDDGLLHPDDQLVDVFEEDCGAVNRQFLRGLTISNLLTMTCPIPFNEASCMTTEEWVKGFLSSPRLGEGGRKFQYNSLNTYMLAAAVTKVTSKPMTEYLEERLFAPMGIADYHWETCPKGIVKGGWGLYMKPEDLAKLGLLVHNRGLWNGRQLLSQSYLNTALHPWVEAPKAYGNFNYGWQIWVGRTENTFLFNGMLGQNVLCYEDNDLLLISNAGNNESFQQGRYFAIADKYFSAPLSQSPLKKDSRAQRQLKKALRDLAPGKNPIPKASEFAAFAERRMISDHPYASSAGLLPSVLQTVQNCYSSGLEAITVGGTRRFPELIYEEKACTHRIIAGVKAPYEQEVDFGGNIFRVAAQAAFAQDEDGNPMIRFRLDFLETPCTGIVKIFLTPGGPIVRQQEIPGGDFLLELMDQLFQGAPAKTLTGAIMGTADPELLRWKVYRLFDRRMTFRLEA